MGQFPEWRGTHIYTNAKSRFSFQVMRLYLNTEGNLVEQADRMAAPRYFSPDWNRHFVGKGRTVTPIPGVVQSKPVMHTPKQVVPSHGAAVTGPQSVLSSERSPVTGIAPQAGERPVVTLSASAAACVFAAAALPEWHCPHGMATANTGDNARLVDFDREAGVKRVQVYNIDPKTHVGEMVDVKVYESVTLELWRDTATN